VHEPVFVTDGARTPFLKARGRPGPFTPADLAVQCGRPLLLRQPFAPSAFDEVVLGCANQLAGEMNVARVAALRLGCGDNMPAWTVHRNCGSGMQSIDIGFRAIAEGRMDLVLAGGTEALSHAPLIVREAAVDWLARWRATGSPAERMRLLGEFDAHWLAPVIGLERGLTDPVVQLNMGQTAEVLAHRFGITRAEADGYAAESQRRLAQAQSQGWLDDEIEPMCDRDGQVFDHDDGVRPDTHPEALARLEPAFEPPFGQVTAGNASQVSDGACWLVLASRRAMASHGLTPLARIVDCEWAALDPAIMGLGPTLAATPLVERHGLAPGAIGLWEINEAFAAQVLACLKAWEDEAYCRDVLGLARPFGRIPHERLNVDGGAIGLGHPVGASGARLVLHLVHALRRHGLRRGIASECIGGGQGGAMLVEAMEGGSS
jgi:acetyl-CoA C-acetyltransferase